MAEESEGRVEQEIWLDLRIELAEVVAVPLGTEVSDDGTFVLPTGERLKPWISFELQPADEETNPDAVYRDLNGDELEKLGVVVGLDEHRSVEEA